jgi:exonuclease III
MIVLNVRAPIEDKLDYMDSFYKELERVFNKSPKYHKKMLLGDLNANVGRKEIYKPIIGNENLHEISNLNGVRVVNLLHQII